MLSLNFVELNLNWPVLAGLKAAGSSKPTPDQEKTIPIALAGRDALGLAQTGTGKAAGLMLPILQRLITGPPRPVRAPALGLSEQR